VGSAAGGLVAPARYRQNAETAYRRDGDAAKGPPSEEYGTAGSRRCRRGCIEPDG